MSARLVTVSKFISKYLRHEPEQLGLVLEPGGGSGFGVLRALRDRPARRKMVVLTGTASTDVRRQCEALGGDGVFDKSIETEALIDWCLALGRQTDIPGNEP